MSRRPVWLNDIERDAFMESNCDRCFQPAQALKRVTGEGAGCPHLIRAEAGKLPKAWTLRRTAAMGDTYRCDDHLDKPPVNRRGVAPADTPPMFDDVEPADRFLVPIDGWPDYKALEREKKRKADHD